LVSSSVSRKETKKYELVCMSVSSETGVVPVSKVTLLVDGVEQTAESSGSGPVDATYSAIESLVNSGVSLQLYSVNNITSGTDSQGEVTVRVERGGRIVNGLGADTDIVIASAKAYIHALNLMESVAERQHPQGDV
jgi:2-isopropylmalate synthase